MKKIVGLLSFAFLVLSSCSSDNDESSNLPNPILVKEIEVTYEGKTFIQKNTYDGNKIKNTTSQTGLIVNYTYTGDVITKKEDIDVQKGVSSVSEYTYKDGKVISVLNSVILDYYLKPVYESLRKYTYNEDGTVSYQVYKVNSVTGAEEEKDDISGKLTLKNGNIVRDDFTNVTFIFEYDNKNNVYKNILGYNLLMEVDSGLNNLVKSFSIYNGKASDPNVNLYEYNSEGYPSKKLVGVVNGVPIVELKYIY